MKNTFLITMCDLSLEALKAYPPDETRILMIESQRKWQALPFHRKKMVLGISAMRHFALELQRAGYEVDYRHEPDFASGIQAHDHQYQPGQILAFQPREWGMLQILQRLSENLPLTQIPNPFYFLPREEFIRWADSQQNLRMENFYRWMRRRENILIQNGKPAGGQWNFDKQNRRPPPNRAYPDPPFVEPDAITREVIQTVQAQEGFWGSADDFRLPVTRAEAWTWMEHFFRWRFADFGPYEDAMRRGDWLVTHSMLSAFLNLGLLHPREVVERAIQSAEEYAVPLNSLEGFVRQVLGWREYIHGMYWYKMPEHRAVNYFELERNLPDWYWQPDECELACLRDSIEMVKQHGFAHHIHRLMVLSNFATLAGVNPLRLSEWFWAGFVDAYEWVELPNVLGMATYADGGLLASKPYISSGSYIHKMSDYCSDCRFDVHQKLGENACPFNYLYWYFLDRQREKLSQNPRMTVIYRLQERKSAEEKAAIRRESEHFLARLPQGNSDYHFQYDAG